MNPKNTVSARGGKSGPFTRAIRYSKDGWSPIPVGRDKKPLVRGYHGKTNNYQDLVTVEKWVRRYPDANIALRLLPDFIGIDVDAYGGKAGAETLRALEADLGPLPGTYISTSRRDGISGIRLFRVPLGLSWPGTAGPGIDIIHWANRYVIVPPSLHHTGRRYRWNRAPSPILEDIPSLPQEWAEALPGMGAGAEAEPVPRGRNGGTLNRLRAALAEHGDGEPCGLIASDRDRAIAVMAAGGSAHDAALNAVWGILRDWSIGHVGPSSALRDVRDAFLAAPGPRARSRTALGEWQAMASGITPPRWPGGERPPDPCRELDALEAITRMMKERKARNATR